MKKIALIALSFTFCNFGHAKKELNPQEIFFSDCKEYALENTELSHRNDLFTLCSGAGENFKAPASCANDILNSDQTTHRFEAVTILCSGVQNDEQAQNVKECFEDSISELKITEVRFLSPYASITTKCRHEQASGSQLEKDKLKLLSLVNETYYNRDLVLLSGLPKIVGGRPPFTTNADSDTEAVKGEVTPKTEKKCIVKLIQEVLLDTQEFDYQQTYSIAFKGPNFISFEMASGMNSYDFTIEKTNLENKKVFFTGTIYAQIWEHSYQPRETACATTPTGNRIIVRSSDTGSIVVNKMDNKGDTTIDDWIKKGNQLLESLF